MRHAAIRRGEHPSVGEVLSRGDVVHSLRHRGRLPLSMGGGLPGNVEGKPESDFRRDGFISRDPVCRLHLRLKEKGVRLEIVIKFGTSGWRGLIARDFTFDNVRLATQGIALYLKAELERAGSPIAGCDP